MTRRHPNLYGVELSDTYGPHALCQTDAIRWAWLSMGGSA